MKKGPKKGNKNKKKMSIKQTRPNLASVLLIVVALALYLGIVWFFITQSYQQQPLQVGRLSSTQAYTGEDYAKSLDLRIASKASYPSSAINIVKDLTPDGGVRKQIISFQVAVDNLTEYALMSLPAGNTPAGGYPTIILCHGYYNPEQYNTLTGYINDMDFYSQHGFAVIKPDFRGQGLSINQGQPEGSYYSMAYNTDAMSLISAVKKTTYLDKNDINLWGHSMGAYVALRAAVLSPDIKNLILLSGPVGTPQDMFSDYSASSDRDNPAALKLREAALLKYGTPVTDPKFWDETSPLDFLSHLNAEVQINVSNNDNVVPPVFSADLDKALTKANKAHQYFIYDGGGHGMDSDMPLIWQRSLQLLSTGGV